MKSRERVLTALARNEPDRVPYCEFSVDRVVAAGVLGTEAAGTHAFNIEANQYTPDEYRALAHALNLDNMPYILRAPVYADKVPGKDGRLYYGEGQIKGPADLGLIELPDPNDEQLYEDAAGFAQEKGDFAACFVTRIGVFSAILSTGLDRFSLFLYDNVQFIEDILDIYVEWAVDVAKHISSLGFDVYVTTDDMAFNTAPYFSPDVFRELIWPRFRKVAEHITIPWIHHSDGNLTPILDDLSTIGIAGLHPIEKGAMDIERVKASYGDRLCLLGNVDLNILAEGTEEETDAEVKSLIRGVGPGGGYICTSGNSLASYCKPENALAMSRAVMKYGKYPIDFSL